MLHGESVTRNPSVAIGERTQMIKAAIVGWGWRGSISHRELASSAQCLAVGAPVNALSRTRPYRPKVIVTL